MTTPSNSALPVVDTLVATLDQERAALTALSQALADQLAALRERANERLADGADHASEATAELARLRLVRERQTRLTARVLGVEMPEGGALTPLVDALRERDPVGAERLRDARAAVRAEAQTADARSRELAYALDVAVRVGREILQAWQHVEAPTPTAAYTAAGRTADAPRRPLVNQLG